MTDTLSFKEMCARFDVTPRTLRYYEYIELLSPQKEGRSRFYGPREVARLTLILRGKRFGFSLEEIRQWLLMYDRQGTDEQMRTLVKMSDRQISVLQEQRNELDQAIEDLKNLRDEVAAKGTDTAQSASIYNE
ncbi:MerR family transcriptional regulator [Thioclava sp. SK-1]|uniref:MerR family transcriptional regulator n=1 Tax=Thioclava sp. SK-1 TaxID=1889770 RepID=UPI0008242FE0|nr:MerR family DNA-binding transcriptional regulator [Thioclava sp. SK-1]OCX66737.1 MerR family transcriptional regulator [Thioclava sp. SK-1]